MLTKHLSKLNKFFSPKGFHLDRSYCSYNIILVYTFLWNICFHPYVKMTCKPGLWWQWYVNQAWGEPVVPLASIFYTINQNLIKLEWNLSKPNLLVTKVCVQIIKVKIKISYIRTLFKVWFIQDLDLLRVQFRQESLYIVSHLLNLSVS